MNKIIEIKAPKTLGGESITEGIVKIKKNVGELVKVDDLIFEIETDKTAIELTAEAPGRITKFFVKEYDVVYPNQLLAKLSVEEVEENIIKEEDKSNNLTKKDAPSARKIMEENLISSESIKGTGMGSRITKKDVIDHLNKSIGDKEKQCEFAVLQNAVNRDQREKRVKMSKIRQVIATRLKESQNTAAILTTFNEINMQNVINLRTKYKENFEKRYGIKLGFMPFFIKATVQALKEIPEINAEISNDEIIYKHYYDIGVAVSIDNGLVVPVIRNADRISFAEVELILSDLSKKARESKLQVSEIEGATFTISNGGVYGSLLSTPIINPPQSGILGIHSIQNRPIASSLGTIEIKPMMYIALSYDHRIVDGKEAITFLVKIKNYIEDPNRLLLEI